MLALDSPMLAPDSPMCYVPIRIGTEKERRVGTQLTNVGSRLTNVTNFTRIINIEKRRGRHVVAAHIIGCNSYKIIKDTCDINTSVPHRSARPTPSYGTSCPC